MKKLVIITFALLAILSPVWANTYYQTIQTQQGTIYVTIQDYGFYLEATMQYPDGTIRYMHGYRSGNQVNWND